MRPRTLLLAAAAILAAAGVVTGAALTTHGAGPETGPVRTAQPFSLAPVVAGAPSAILTAAPTRPTIVTFFAAWCAPCTAELPLIEAASHRQGAPTVVGIDEIDQRADAVALLDKAKATFPAGYDHDGSVGQDWGVDGLPVTVFIAPGGRIVDYHRGQLGRDQLDHFIAALESAAR